MPPYIVKYTPYRQSEDSSLSRMTWNGSALSKDGLYKFVIDSNLQEADFWIVHGKGLREPEICNVPPQNVISLSTEPHTILHYPNSYLKQFGMVATCQECVKHRNRVLCPPFLPWFVGREFSESEQKYVYAFDLNGISAAPAPEKTKLISVISSNKAFSRGHIQRIRFVEKLKEHFGDRIDIFGNGFRSVPDKWDALAPYKYHIVIENSSLKYYWTEKLSDCFIAQTYPFYYGCTNVFDYFPKNSCTPIDISNPQQVIDIIEKAITEDKYQQSLNELAECKELCIDKYNQFERMADLCRMLNPHAPKQSVTIKPCVSGLNLKNFLNYTFKRPFYQLLYKLHIL